MIDPLKELLQLLNEERYYNDEFGTGSTYNTLDEYQSKEKLKEFIRGMEKFEQLNYELPRSTRYLCTVVLALIREANQTRKRLEVYDHLFAAMLGDKTQRDSLLDFLKINSSMSDLDKVEVISKIFNVQSVE